MWLRAILYISVFLVCVAVLAKVRSRTIRQALLLVACYTLYFTWGYWFGAVLVTSTVMNFLVGKWLRRRPSPLALSIGILLNLALLGSFKYLPEIAVTLPFSSLPFSLQRFAHLALPVGISFWTFQAMSYLFDLYRESDNDPGENGELNPTFPEFAVYMAFFPVTISGPICRMPEMLPQFRSETPTSAQEIGHGLRRIATGVLMMQLAKLLGQGILAGDGIASGFDRVTHWTGADVWCLAFGYGLQLFLDFAGYSHIAIGAAQALGFTIPENFARPFQSTSPSVFWTRWHMSLSFWIRDYVFLPLAVIRREIWWRNLVLVVSMILFGVWHKATLLFVLWGCYHGVLLVLQRQVQQLQRRWNWDPPTKFWEAFSWAVTISLVSVGWIFFRANSPLEAREMLSAIFSPATYLSHALSGSLYLLVAGVAAGYAVALVVIDALDRNSGDGFVATLARWRWFWIAPLYAIALVVVLIVTLSRGTSTAQMMYGNF